MAMWENYISSLCSNVVRITDGDEFSWFFLIWVSHVVSNAHKNVVFNETIGSDACTVHTLPSRCPVPHLVLWGSDSATGRVCVGMYTLSQALVGQRGESLVLTVEECVSTPVQMLMSNMWLSDKLHIWSPCSQLSAMSKNVVMASQLFACCLCSQTVKWKHSVGCVTQEPAAHLSHVPMPPCLNSCKMWHSVLHMVTPRCKMHCSPKVQT